MIVSTQKDGEDIHTWGGSICRRVLDNYVEGYKGSKTMSYTDHGLVGMTSTCFWVDSTRDTT
jgi:hypothetical protein